MLITGVHSEFHQSFCGDEKMQTIVYVWQMAWKDNGWMPPAIWIGMILMAIMAGRLAGGREPSEKSEKDTPVSSR